MVLGQKKVICIEEINVYALQDFSLPGYSRLEPAGDGIQARYALSIKCHKCRRIDLDSTAFIFESVNLNVEAFKLS